MRQTKDVIRGLRDHMLKTKKVNPLAPLDLKELYKSGEYFSEMVNYLADEIGDETAKKNFYTYANNARGVVLEHMAATGKTYFETFTLPVLMTTYPKLITPIFATELPMDKPTISKQFLRVFFTPSGSTESYEGPVYDRAISGGQEIEQTILMPLGSNDPGDLTANGDAFDALAAISQDASVTHIARGSFRVVGFNHGTAPGTDVVLDSPIVPQVKGAFTGEISDGSNTDYLLGEVKYREGIIRISQVGSNIANLNSVTVKYRLSLEENTMSPKVDIREEQFDIEPMTRQIEGTYTIPYQTDTKAMFNIDPASKIVDSSSEQIALDIDIDAINKIREVAAKLKAASDPAYKTFAWAPPTGSSYTETEHHRDILNRAGRIKGHIAKASKIAQGEMFVLTNFSTGSIWSSMANVELVRKEGVGAIGFAYKSVNKGEYNTLETPILNDEEMFMIMKGVDDVNVISYLANYVTGMTFTYPKSTTPAVTQHARTEFQLVRDTGIGSIEITF